MSIYEMKKKRTRYYKFKDSANHVGCLNYPRKLTVEKAKTIKERLSNGEAAQSLALEYNVSLSSINGIKYGNSTYRKSV